MKNLWFEIRVVLVLVPHINGTEKLVLGLVLPKTFPVLVLVSVLQIKLGLCNLD
jgi:hypothetical protein